MPTYQYACTECGHRLEAVQSFTDQALTTCPSCEGALRKVFSPVGVVFKGSGFYRTDSRAAARGKDSSSSDSSGSKESSTASSGSGKAADGKSASSSSSSSDSSGGRSGKASSNGHSAPGAPTAKPAASAASG
ncbi:MAG TPA: FmdB family zinc ribbon protein [Cryptosporangiaceae bacterium]|nr:FmdB family zinc ribbon protein [Cryptosporangiaceae bacterium]